MRAQNFVLAAECKQKVDALANKLSDINTNLKEVVKQKEPVVEVVSFTHIISCLIQRSGY